VTGADVALFDAWGRRAQRFEICSGVIREL
jgi:hypothetical protein